MMTRERGTSTFSAAAGGVTITLSRFGRLWARLMMKAGVLVYLIGVLAAVWVLAEASNLEADIDHGLPSDLAGYSVFRTVAGEAADAFDRLALAEASAIQFDPRVPSTFDSPQSVPEFLLDIVYSTKQADGNRPFETMFIAPLITQVRFFEDAMTFNVQGGSFEFQCFKPAGSDFASPCARPRTILNRLYPGDVNGTTVYDGSGNVLVEDIPGVFTSDLLTDPDLADDRLFFADSEFRESNPVTQLTRTRFTFGIPLTGYVSARDRPEAQAAEFAAFAEALNARMSDLAPRLNAMSVGWFGPVFTQGQLDNQLLADGRFLLAGLAGFYAVIGLATGSLCFAMSALVISTGTVAGSLVLAQALGLAYIHVLIGALGLGTAVIQGFWALAYWNAWKQSRWIHFGEFSGPIRRRLSFVNDGSLQHLAIGGLAALLGFALHVFSDNLLLRYIGMIGALMIGVAVIYSTLMLPATVVLVARVSRYGLLSVFTSRSRAKISAMEYIPSPPPEDVPPPNTESKPPSVRARSRRTASVTLVGQVFIPIPGLDEAEAQEDDIPPPAALKADRRRPSLRRRTTASSGGVLLPEPAALETWFQVRFSGFLDTNYGPMVGFWVAVSILFVAVGAVAALSVPLDDGRTEAVASNRIPVLDALEASRTGFASSNQEPSVHVFWGLPGLVRSASGQPGRDGSPAGALGGDGGDGGSAWSPILSPEAQTYLLSVCASLRTEPTVANGEVACPVDDLRSFQLARGGPWPVPEIDFLDTLAEFRLDQVSNNTAFRRPASGLAFPSLHTSFQGGWLFGIDDDSLIGLKIHANLTFDIEAGSPSLSAARETWDSLVDEINRSAPAELGSASHASYQWVAEATWAPSEFWTTWYGALGAGALVTFVVTSACLVDPRHIWRALAASFVAQAGGTGIGLLALGSIGSAETVLFAAALGPMSGAVGLFLQTKLWSLHISDPYLQTQHWLTEVGISVVTWTGASLLLAVLTFPTSWLWMAKTGVWLMALVLPTSIFSLAALATVTMR